MTAIATQIIRLMSATIPRTSSEYSLPHFFAYADDISQAAGHPIIQITKASVVMLLMPNLALHLARRGG
jgi:hypothetical protein